MPVQLLQARYRRVTSWICASQSKLSAVPAEVFFGCLGVSLEQTVLTLDRATSDAARQLDDEGFMYHAIVKRIAKKNFERVNQKDFESLANDCARNVYHRFGGNHALGGERHDRETLRRWLARLGRLGPGLKLTVHDVWVKGLPHNTIVIVRWSATDTLPDGSRYHNHGVHIIRMRWGKIVEIDANEDSQAVAESLKVRAAYGLQEALAPQIVS